MEHFNNDIEISSSSSCCLQWELIGLSDTHLGKAINNNTIPKSSRSSEFILILNTVLLSCKIFLYIAERSWFEENTFCCQMFIFNFSKLFSRFYWIFASEEFYNVSCAWRNRLPANILSLLSEKLFLRVVFENQNKIPQKEAALMICLNWFMSPIPETRFSPCQYKTSFQHHTGACFNEFFSFSLDGLVNYKCLPSLSSLWLSCWHSPFLLPFLLTHRAPWNRDAINLLSVALSSPGVEWKTVGEGQDNQSDNSWYGCEKPAFIIVRVIIARTTRLLLRFFAVNSSFIHCRVLIFHVPSLVNFEVLFFFEEIIGDLPFSYKFFYVDRWLEMTE